MGISTKRKFGSSGQERFRTVTRCTTVEPDGFIVFYNVQQRLTFDYVTHVLKEVGKSCKNGSDNFGRHRISMYHYKTAQ